MAYHIGDEEVRGVIIGGDFTAWMLCYDGKPVSSRRFSDNDDEAIKDATKLKHHLMAENKVLGLYQDPNKYDVRLW